MSTQPLISVIVPIFNAEPYLDQCLSSIEGQTCRDLEIICLNDGSTDGSLETMRAHAEDDRRIVVIDKSNQGYGATCNRGLDEAHGKWISIIEPDDWIEPDMYRAMMAHAESLDARVDIVKTPYWRIIDPDTPQQRKINCSYRRRVKVGAQPFPISAAPHLLRHHPSIWSAVYRADFLRENGIRFHEIPGAGWADNPFLVDTLCQTDCIAYMDAPFYCYREETPEKSKATALNNTMMPFDRWMDMADSIERIGRADETVLRELYQRAFTYFDGTVEFTGERDDVMKAMTGIVNRMERVDLVLDNPDISPAQKELFVRLRGLGDDARKRIKGGTWKKKLVGEALYSLRNAGIGYTASMVKKTLGK